jgi:hypothetical protein
MRARKKVVAPVTPRIVQGHPSQKLFWYVALFCLFFLTAWFSYDYGKRRAPAITGAPVVQSHTSERETTELEQERDTLRQQVEGLQRSMQQAHQDLAAAQARVQALQQAQSSPHQTSATVLTSSTTSVLETEAEPATTVSETVDNTLRLENVHVEATDSENVFRISFSVMRDGDSSDRVTGTIWIAVNGYTDGEPKRLSFKRLSPERRSYVKMGFDLQQDVSEDVVLPENFLPKNILIEAKPYGDLYTGASVQIAWLTAG